MAIPARFERATYRLEVCCSILLSYGTIKSYCLVFHHSVTFCWKFFAHSGCGRFQPTKAPIRIPTVKTSICLSPSFVYYIASYLECQANSAAKASFIFLFTETFLNIKEGVNPWNPHPLSRSFAKSAASSSNTKDSMTCCVVFS